MQSGSCTAARQRERESWRSGKGSGNTQIFCAAKESFISLSSFSLPHPPFLLSVLQMWFLFHVPFFFSFFVKRETGSVFLFDGGSDHGIGQSIGLAWFSAGVNVVGIAKGWRGLIVWHLLSSPGSQERYCQVEYGFRHAWKWADFFFHWKQMCT